MAARARIVLVSLEPDLLDLLEAMPELELVGFLDHSDEASDAVHANLGRDADWPRLLSEHAGLRAVLGVDPPHLRARLAGHYGLDNLHTVIAPDAVVSPRAAIGSASVLQRGVHVGRNSVLGVACKLNVGAAVHHDCRIGDHTTLAPGCRLLGTVSVGAQCYIGAGAIVLPRRTIGDGAVIGAGAVVTTDIAGGSVVAGVPARALHSPGVARR